MKWLELEQHGVPALTARPEPFIRPADRDSALRRTSDFRPCCRVKGYGTYSSAALER